MTGEKFLKMAEEFHGHLGPFLVLGLKAGMLATETLGKNPFEMRCTVKSAPKPPRSCFIDGVQFASGCTLGKGNISTEDSNEVAASFFRNDKKIQVRVKDEILQKLGRGLPEERLEEVAREFFKKDYEALFEVEGCTTP